MTTVWPAPDASTAAAGPPAPTGTTTTGRRPRVQGVDLARALAIGGMLVAHFVARAEQPSVLDSVRAFVDGRAMPLFVLLSGVSVTLLARSARHPDRALLVRAALFLPLGLALQEWTVGIAIILQYYALFLTVAVGLRRLGDRTLLAVAAAVTAVAGVTVQLLGPRWPGYQAWRGGRGIVPPWGLLANLTVNGYYPMLPAIAFLIVGLWLGRRDLGDARVAGRLLAVGVALGLVGYVGGRALEARLATAGTIGASASAGAGPAFVWARLADAAGHSEMPAWVIGSTGTACAALGACLLVARRTRRTTAPFVALGQLSLSAYVAQALVIRWTPAFEDTTIAQQSLIALALFAGLTLGAWAWRRVARRGPLEALVHVVSRS